MRAPNVETIAASLRNCSLSSRERNATPSEPPPPPPPLPFDPTIENAGVTVELNSEVALPQHWEQCLDMRTGEVYYINRKDGSRTTEDPRAFTACYYSSGDDESSGDESSSGSCGDGRDSSPSSGETADGGGEILVAAGCKGCFMYFMVPKRVDECPKCSGGLLHLGRNGSF